MNFMNNIKGYISPKIQEDFFDNNNTDSGQPLFKYFLILLNLSSKYQNINTNDGKIFNYSYKILYELLMKLIIINMLLKY